MLSLKIHNISGPAVWSQARRELILTELTQVARETLQLSSFRNISTVDHRAEEIPNRKIPHASFLT